MLGGFHIEEAIYGPLYYYPGQTAGQIREYEEEMPKDAILVHLTAKPEIIQARLEANPHEYSLIEKADIPMLKSCFQEGLYELMGRPINSYRPSWKQKYHNK